jgi:antitoxin HicB
MNDLNIEEIIKRPYTIEVVFNQNEDTSGWFARVVEWPGCMTQAENFSELGEMIEDAMRAWVETCLEEGLEIPEPRPVEAHSGKFVVRVPKSLHRELVESAERDGVSLNAFVNVALAKAVGEKKAPQRNQANYDHAFLTGQKSDVPLVVFEKDGEKKSWYDG